MRVKIKKLHPDAVIPKYAKHGDAGMDLIATSFGSDIDSRVTLGTGLAVEIPEGYVALLFPRSSICKTAYGLSNSVGVIDSGYRGEIKAVFNTLYNPDFNKTYGTGDRIIQMIILPYPKIEFEEVEELSETERGMGGFGSTNAN